MPPSPLPQVALLGTKACLGWDRMMGAATTGTTAVVDLWLQLLLRCLQATATVRAQEAADRAAEATEPPPPPGAPLPQSTPLQAARAAQRRKAAALEMDLQGLLLQIAANWRALHPAVRPRAVWLCASHLQLKSVPDGGWNSLVDAIRGLLLESRKGDGAAYWPAVAEGAMALPVAAAGAAAAGAAAGQAAEVALLSLERLAALVAYNAAAGGRELAAQLAPVAGLLERLVRLEVEGSQQGGPGEERRSRCCCAAPWDHLRCAAAVALDLQRLLLTRRACPCSHTQPRVSVWRACLLRCCRWPLAGRKRASLAPARAGRPAAATWVSPCRRPRAAAMAKPNRQRRWCGICCPHLAKQGRQRTP